MKVMDVVSYGYGAAVMKLEDGRVAVCDGKRVMMRWAEPGDELPRVPQEGDVALTGDEDEEINFAAYQYFMQPEVRNDPKKRENLEPMIHEYFDGEW